MFKELKISEEQQEEYSANEKDKILTWLRDKKGYLQLKFMRYHALCHETRELLYPAELSSDEMLKPEFKYKSNIGPEIMDCVASLNSYTADQATGWASFVPKRRPNDDMFEFSKWEHEQLRPAFYGFVRDPKTGTIESSIVRSREAVLYGATCRYAAHRIAGDGSELEEDDGSGLSIEDRIIKSGKWRRTLRFETAPMEQVVFERSWDGELSFVAREMTLSHEAAATRWGRTAIMEAFDYSDLGDWYRRAATETSVFTHYCTLRNELFQPGNGSNYIGVVTSNDEKLVNFNDELDIMPYIISEFLPGTCGHLGYAMLAPLLPDIRFNDKLTNIYQKLLLFRTAPPIMTVDKFPLSKGDLQPGAILPAALGRDGKRNIEPLITQTDHRDLYQALVMSTTQIKEKLLFGTLSHPEGTAGMTDTEIRKLAMARITRIKPVITTWVQQDMIPMCQHILHWLFNVRGGNLEWTPEVLGIQTNENPVDALDIEYSGLLSQEERDLENMQIDAFLGYVANIEATAINNPIFAEDIDVRKAIEAKFDNLNITENIVRSREDAQHLSKQRVNSQQQAQQMQMALQQQGR
jgi:hypothetical protein